MEMRQKINHYVQLFYEICRKKSFPALSAKYEDNEKIAIITVNYNTCEQILLLLFSIYKNLGNERVSDIVVVDNHSTDGSRPVLTTLHDNGFIELIANERQRYHGPGLNQALNHLASQVRKGFSAFRYIWILDSDTIILRKDILERAFSFMQESGSLVIGQFQDNGYPHISSIWMDPYRVWNSHTFPFTRDGWPSLRFYRSILHRKGLIRDFSFMRDAFVLHLGESTLQQIFLHNDSGNELFEWATTYHKHHYHGNRNGKGIHDKVMKLYNFELEMADGELVKLFSSPANCQADFAKIVNAFSEG